MNLIFMGTPQAAVPSLERVVAEGHKVLEVWTQPDRPSGRGRHIIASPVKICAQKLGLRLFQPEKIKSRESRNRFAGHEADLAVVVAYGRILTKTYLTAFTFGCVNVHFSLLPQYRGAAPVNWAIANGERMTGVTTMRMDAGLDTGDILLSKAVEIRKDETAVELTDRLAIVGADLLSETLRDLASIRPKPQDDSVATYAPLFSKNDGKIEWDLKAKTLSDKIRGFQPFPKSFSFFEGERVTFWKAEAIERGSSGKPGQVMPDDDGEMIICCGEDTLLRVDELQFAGKNRVSGVDFMRGVKINAGDRFGDEK